MFWGLFKLEFQKGKRSDQFVQGLPNRLTHTVYRIPAHYELLNYNLACQFWNASELMLNTDSQACCPRVRVPVLTCILVKQACHPSIDSIPLYGDSSAVTMHLSCSVHGNTGCDDSISHLGVNQPGDFTTGSPEQTALSLLH